MKKLISVILCAAMLLGAAILPANGADYTPDKGAFIFDSEDSLGLLSFPHDLTAAYDGDFKALKLTATANPFDPRVLIDFEDTVSADDYKYLVFTYMMPATVSGSPSVAEIFLSAGSTKLPTAGKSINFALTRGSVFITERFDLTSYSWWNGNINNIRLDVFDYAREGDCIYVDSVILTKTLSDANAAAGYRAAARGGETDMSEDYICNSYEWDKYTSPFWKGGIVYNEAVYPIKDQNGGTTYTLMYTPDVVTAVYDAQFKVKYREGVDYKISGNKITFLPTGAMPIKEYTYLHPTNNMIPAGYSGWSPYYKRHAAGDGKYDYHTAEVARQYINVTYTHSDVWNGPVPAQHSDLLPRTAAKIQNKGSLNVVYYGDSLCGGARASAYENIYPYAEWWNQQITTALKKGCGVNVNATYSSVGGSTASSMSSSSTIAQYVMPYNPDLVVIEFGVNDAQNESVGDGNSSALKSSFKNAVMSIITQIRARYPDCEFLLVAPFYSNVALFGKVYFEVCRDALNEIASTVSGSAVADVTTIHDYLLGFKNYADFSGDNLCHPNDYMSRIFSQVCLEAIVPGGVDAYVPTGDIDDPGHGDPDDPDEPDPTVVNASSAAPDGHGWYWSEDEAYCFIGGYGKNSQDIIVTADICLLPASDSSCAHLFTDDATGGLWVYADHVVIGANTIPYEWGNPSWGNWHTVSFAIKNGVGSVTIDGELIGSGSGFKAFTEYQMVFSHYGSMVIDNLTLKSSAGTTYWSCNFENRSDAEGHMSEGLGVYTDLYASTVSYDANGGKGAPANQIKVDGISLAITSDKPTREGYTFMGWATSPDSTEADYASGAAYTADSSAKLYAVWASGEAHEHSFGEWTVTEAPTCIETGIETRVCACGEAETRTIPATGHTEGETEVTPATCTENGRSLVCCTVCGYHISDIPIQATGHVFSHGVCTVCGAVDSSFLAGDVDLDGKLTAKDVNILKKAITGTVSLDGAEERGDMNSDTKLSAADVNMLKKAITGSDAE